MSVCSSKSGSFLSVFVNDTTSKRKKLAFITMLKKLMDNIDLEEPTRNLPTKNTVGCT